MNTEPTPEHEQKPHPPYEPIPKRILYTLPVDELEKRLQQIFTSIEGLFITISTQRSASYEQQSTPLQTLEQDFNTHRKALDATIDVIMSYAEISAWYEHQFHRLVHGARDGVACLQSVTSAEDVTPEWLAQRDALVAQTRKLIDDEWLFTITQKEGTTPP